jgi:XTP/dITP diphosphohydrolase
VTRVYACSSNTGKLREFDLVATEMGSTGITLVSLPGLKDIPPPDETGETFESNAAEKALYYSGFASEIVLADDSGIEVPALGDAPGVYSARYATPHLPDRHSQDAANNALLLLNMQGQADRTARFVCTIALAQQGKMLHVVRGIVEGRLLESAQGANGFGYDPLFFYPPFGCTFAELDASRKFAVSHRGSALRQILTWLQSQNFR